MNLPNDFEIQAELDDLGVEPGASEIHGLLSGWLAAGGKIGKDWLQALILDNDIRSPETDSQLASMLAVTQRQLKDPEFGFQPLLPDEDEPLTDQVEKLFDWCTGFVAGFGLAGGGQAELSPESEEALQDLVTISKSTIADDPDEDSYAEILEYVRVAAMLLHGDVAMARDYRNSLN